MRGDKPLSHFWKGFSKFSSFSGSFLMNMLRLRVIRGVTETRLRWKQDHMTVVPIKGATDWLSVIPHSPARPHTPSHVLLRSSYGTLAPRFASQRKSNPLGKWKMSGGWHWSQQLSAGASWHVYFRNLLTLLSSTPTLLFWLHPFTPSPSFPLTALQPQTAELEEGEEGRWGFAAGRICLHQQDEM